MEDDSIDVEDDSIDMGYLVTLGPTSAAGTSSDNDTTPQLYSVTTTCAVTAGQEHNVRRVI